VPDVVSLEFSDFDPFREHLRGWDTDPVQLGAGQLQLCWSELKLPDFGIAGLALNRRSTDISAVDDGWLVFTICLRPQIWCGLEVRPGSLLIAAPGRDYRSFLPAGFSTLEIALPELVLDDLGFPCGGIKPTAFPPEECVLRLEPRLAASFERLTRQLAVPVGAGPSEPLTTSWALATQGRVLVLLTRALRKSRNRDFRRAPRYDLAHAAFRLIEANMGENLTVRDLVQTLGVTRRALEYSFSSVLGISPARYLLARRLNGVRQDLLTTPWEGVTTAALRNGFHHLGRFSGQYRRFFGELPSQTAGSRSLLRSNSSI